MSCNTITVPSDQNETQHDSLVKDSNRHDDDLITNEMDTLYFNGWLIAKLLEE